jgi:hypothetical protein
MITLTLRKVLLPVKPPHEIVDFTVPRPFVSCLCPKESGDVECAVSCQVRNLALFSESLGSMMVSGANRRANMYGRRNPSSPPSSSVDTEDRKVRCSTFDICTICTPYDTMAHVCIRCKVT